MAGCITGLLVYFYEKIRELSKNKTKYKKWSELELWAVRWLKTIQRRETWMEIPVRVLIPLILRNRTIKAIKHKLRDV